MFFILDKTKSILSKSYKKRANITITKRINSTTLGLITRNTLLRYYIKIVSIFIILI
jgi:hypothetical protein